MERAPCSGSGDVHCGQKKVESVTGARFTQSDSGDSKPICFGRRGCSQWFGCDWSFFCPWSHHDTIPVSTLIFPLLTLTSSMQWCFLYWPSDSTLTSTQKKKRILGHWFWTAAKLCMEICAKDINLWHKTRQNSTIHMKSSVWCIFRTFNRLMMITVIDEPLMDLFHYCLEGAWMPSP